jgi:hypothetical protein
VHGSELHCRHLHTPTHRTLSDSAIDKPLRPVSSLSPGASMRTVCVSAAPLRTPISCFASRCLDHCSRDAKYCFFKLQSFDAN